MVYIGLSIQFIRPIATPWYRCTYVTTHLRPAYCELGPRPSAPHTSIMKMVCFSMLSRWGNEWTESLICIWGPVDVTLQTLVKTTACRGHVVPWHSKETSFKHHGQPHRSKTWYHHGWPHRGDTWRPQPKGAQVNARFDLLTKRHQKVTPSIPFWPFGYLLTPSTCLVPLHIKVRIPSQSI